MLQAYSSQVAFIADKRKYPAFIAGRGSGKTASGAIKAVAKAISGPGIGIIAAPSFPMLEQAAKPEFIKFLTMVSKQDKRLRWYLKKSENKIVFPYIGSEVLFVTLENYDRVRGINASWGWIDEAGYIPFEAWRVMVACVRIVVEGRLPQLFLTTTPKGRNWLYDLFVVKPTARPALQRRFAVHRATSFDNPFIDAGYVEGLGYEGRFYEQEVMGEFVGFEGLVYPMFNRQTMTAMAKTEMTMRPGGETWLGRIVDTTGWWSVIGADVGTRNPTAIITLRVRGDGEAVHHATEFYQAGLGSADIVDAIDAAYREEERRGYPVEGVFLDPSAAAYLTDLRDRDVPVHPADNDITTGVGRVTTILSGECTIDPSCVNLATEFEAYHYPDGARHQHIDKPVKVFDHAMDADRYAIMGIPFAQNSVGAVEEDWADELVAYTG